MPSELDPAYARFARPVRRETPTEGMKRIELEMQDRPNLNPGRIATGAGRSMEGYNASLGAQGPLSAGLIGAGDPETGKPQMVGGRVQAGPLSYQYTQPTFKGAPAGQQVGVSVPFDADSYFGVSAQQTPGQGRTYGANVGGDGWNVSGGYNPTSKSVNANVGYQANFAEGGPVYDELGNVAIGDNTDYREVPGYGAVEAASIGAGKAGANYYKHLLDALHESSDYAKQGLENTVSADGPAYNIIGPAQYMLGSAGAVAAPFTAAAKSVGDAVTELSGNPEIGKRAEIVGGLLPFGGGPATRTGVRTARKAEEEGIKYATQQDGPFYRVRHPGADEFGATDRGIKEVVEHDAGVASADAGSAGKVRSRVPKSLSDEEIQALLKSPDNRLLAKAMERTGGDFQPVNMPTSSLAKQSAIGRTFEIAADGSPEYKAAVFEAYKRDMPEVVKEAGAKNYDDLLAASYKQMAKETKEQFDSLPLSYSFHKNGEGNYASSAEMAKDIHGNNHLYVYQGGEPHDFLHNVDPRTGLNENEMFRAVHDAYGHAAHGNQFGAKGEEIAWGLHQQMYSPLAKLAMTAETRGQNSFVNYTPINAKLKEHLNELEEARVEARRNRDPEKMAKAEELKKKAYETFQYAPQKSVLLPPEFVRTEYTGGMPAYLEAANKPRPGTAVAADLTHFSPEAGLTELDPARYGTGISGAERSRLIRKSGETVPGAVRDRTYFYTSEPGKVTPEAGLGENRYKSRSESLYDIHADPLDFKKLARESLRNKWDTNFNPGTIDPTQFANALDRLITEHGYEGMMNPNAAFPMATIFKPKSVQPFASGGRAVVGHETAAGVPVSLEERKGDMRHRQDSGNSRMAADYGYIDTSKPDHDGMKTDAFVGPHRDSKKVFVVNQQHPRTGKFNEHKVLLGYKDRAHALHDYAHSFGDGMGHKRIHSVVEMGSHELQDWLKKDHTKPLKKAAGGPVPAKNSIKESIARLMKHV